MDMKYVLDPAGTPEAGVVIDHDGLWQCYVQTRDRALRDRLIGIHGRLARILAAKLYARRTVAQVDFDDYLQYAHVGLIESVERFDPARGVKFPTFAATRITGAILNGLESESELHEQLAARRRVVAQRTASLVEAPGDASPDLFARLAEVAVGLAVGFMLEGSGMYQAGESEAPCDSYSGIAIRQLSKRLHDAVAALPERQRSVVVLHYFQQRPFEAIALEMGLSRGRVSQLHKEALARLRSGGKTNAPVDFYF
jgi:RNA polymerase sigma factor for flagellar operon FliA